MEPRTTSQGAEFTPEAATTADAARYQEREVPRPSAAAAAAAASPDLPLAVGQPVVLPTPARGDDNLPSMREAASVTVIHLAAPTSASDVPGGDLLAPSAHDDTLVLDLLVISGQRKRIRCQRDERVSDLKQRVWKDWPRGIYQGLCSASFSRIHGS